MLRSLSYRLMKNDLCLRGMVSALCLRNGCVLHNEGDSFLLVRGKREIRMAKKHMLYAIDTAEHFDTYFSQVASTQHNGHELVDYSYPHLHHLSSGLDFEISSLPEEIPTLESYFRFYRPQLGDLVFDIGAYCGVFTYELAKVVGPTGRVVAFEPDPLNIELLRHNIERHGLANVTVVNAAVSDKNGVAQFNSDGALGSSLTAALDRPSTGATTEVPTISFGAACAQYGVPTFVKVDAEGAELEIVGGAREYLAQHPIHFVLDTSHHRGNGLTNRPVEQLFAECHYTAESSAEYGGFMTTWARPGTMMH